MTHTSPTVELVWAVLSVTGFIFLISHLYNFDKFKSLKLWDSENKGSFKKLMTFAYLTSIPLLMFRSVVFAKIKYEQGYAAIPGHGYIPKPYQLWPASSQEWIFPCQLCFALAWAFEMVSHLEELCFWLFLTTVAPLHRSWFRSYHFYGWALGSAIAVTAMPVVACVRRDDPLKSEAYIFMAGSVGSTVITVVFFRVLWIFPGFLRRIKTEGAGQEVVTRLQTFHTLNVIRVAFRILFVVPLLVLAVDGIRPHHHVNESALGTDLLALMAAVGCMVSSILTLLIFFPRSSTREAGYTSRVRSANDQERSYLSHNPSERANPFGNYQEPIQTPSTFRLVEPGKPSSMWELEEEQIRLPPQFKPRPRRVVSNVHPMVMNFRSPIHITDY